MQQMYTRYRKEFTAVKEEVGGVLSVNTTKRASILLGTNNLQISKAIMERQSTLDKKPQKLFNLNRGLNSPQGHP